MRFYTAQDMGRARSLRRRKRRTPELADMARVFGGQFDDYAVRDKDCDIGRACDCFGEGDVEDHRH